MTKPFVTLLLCLAACRLTAASQVSLEPKDTGAALVNPGMGWWVTFYSNSIGNYGSKLEPSDTLEDFPGLAVVYLRVPWAFLEPEEGKFNWALFDTPAQRWIAKGKKVAIRVTCSENWMQYATPKWVRDAGAKGVDYDWNQGPKPDGKLWDPDFLDPVFLAKLTDFLKAMARRYDGNPNVAYIDVGTFGMWGEGHTFMSSRVSDERTLEACKKHIDLHLACFPHTLLCISDDMAGHNAPGRHFPITDYALSKGVTLRDDSIMVQPPPNQWYHAEMAGEFWPKLPVIVEHEHMGGSKQRGAWGDGSALLKAVEEYHASYLSIHWWPREELMENRALIDRINLRLGYRLQLRKIAWPAQVKRGERFSVATLWANAGVAPCYGGGFWALTLKDAKNGIVSVLVDEDFDMRSLEVAAPGSAKTKTLQSDFTIARSFGGIPGPATAPGDYTVFVSVGQRDGTPTIALPLADDDNSRRYKLGQIQLLP